MKKQCLVPVFFFCVMWAQAAGDPLVAGSRSASLAGISVILQDLWSAGNNPAGLAFVKGLQAGIWAENRFLLESLSTAGAAVAFNHRPGTFAFHTSHFGNTLYGELAASLSYGRLFGRSFAAGLRLSVFSIHIAGKQNSKTLATCALGCQYKPDRRWLLGLVIENPIPVSISQETNEVIPAIIKAGICGSFGDNFKIMAEAVKGIDQPLILCAGVEYTVIKKLGLRMGYSSSPGGVSAGTSILLDRFEFAVSAGFHPVLGWTPGISIQSAIIKSKK